MNKIRVYELAKLLGKTNPELLERLKTLKIEVKNHMSSIDMDVAQMIEDSFKKDNGDKKPISKGDTAPDGQPGMASASLESDGRDENKSDDGASKIVIDRSATVGDIAKLLDREPSEMVKLLIKEGFMIPANAVPSDDILTIISVAFGCEITVKDSAGSEGCDDVSSPDEALQTTETDAPGVSKRTRAANAPDARQRSPIVTVMGHVDHGKTTLLDFIRHTRVTEGEAGGITQHIGAYKVDYNGNEIVFLDTPGHEAFTAMRARGAGVTDIAILVVAADDGVMPQTLEAMNHAKAAGVPIIVAVNKIDKPSAKPDRVRQQLSDYGLVPEEWGGDTIMVDIAAKVGTGIDALLEMILIMSEMAELKASPTVSAEGVVVEANLDKGKGPVATVIVQQGTIKKGSIIATKTAWGKVRAMLDDNGRAVDSAGPSTPVEILGLENVPMPGETFRVMSSEKEARDLVNADSRRDQDQSKSRSRLTLEELFQTISSDDIPQLNVVLKCDVQGSLEAFHSTLMKMSTDEVRINIIHEAVGRISESDVTLASVSNAIIIGFNVRPDANAKKLSDAENIQIRLYRVIYDMQEDIKAALEGMLAPTLRENTVGQAEIRASFKVPRIGRIAGCFVRDGVIRRGAKVRVLRDGVVVWDGSLSGLRHFKEDVREIASGNECGLSFSGFQDFREGDQIEAYEILSEKKTLDI
ncbi:MAG: translation initiation factor IF-2 [Synergistaceae bacterium]|jgi:translation initiation factor IF-2|nr:translation initiation factor IF-2 [Synergistaceae bacterium]